NEQAPNTIRLTPHSLKALAHPLRVAMLGLLRADGPATASKLARRLETSSGATSYHLRQLERHGFVVEVPGMGTGRERYWEARHDYTIADRSHMQNDADAVVLFDEFMRLSSNLREVEVVKWIESQNDWGDAWTDASASDDYLLRLNQAELAEMVESIRVLIVSRAARPEDEAPDDSAAVRVHLVAFPVADPGAALIEAVKLGDS
ncbi:MAG: helix-turn-helix domain-containing protein, partial [Actinomycetota bacterium]|nr:helix-turn-helix domain-containing protein [Actinomycetota bacterium]